MSWRWLSGFGTFLVALSGAYAAGQDQEWTLPLAAATALATGLGAELHARLHPGIPRRTAGLLGGFWVAPALTSLAAVLLSAALAGPVAGPAQLVPPAGGLLIGFQLLAQDRELRPGGDSRWARIGYALVLHLVAFVCLGLLLAGRLPGLVGAVGVGLVCALTAAALFRATGEPLSRRWLLAAACGLALGELAFALNTWSASLLFSAALLLLLFYTLSGLLQALLERALDGRLALEYAVVVLLGTGLVFVGLRG